MTTLRDAQAATAALLASLALASCAATPAGPAPTDGAALPSAERESLDLMVRLGTPTGAAARRVAEAAGLRRLTAAEAAATAQIGVRKQEGDGWLVLTRFLSDGVALTRVRTRWEDVRVAHGWRALPDGTLCQEEGPGLPSWCAALYSDGRRVVAVPDGPQPTVAEPGTAAWISVGNDPVETFGAEFLEPAKAPVRVVWDGVGEASGDLLAWDYRPLRGPFPARSPAATLPHPGGTGRCTLLRAPNRPEEARDRPLGEAHLRDEDAGRRIRVAIRCMDGLSAEGEGTFATPLAGRAEARDAAGRRVVIEITGAEDMPPLGRRLLGGGVHLVPGGEAARPAAPRAEAAPPARAARPVPDPAAPLGALAGPTLFRGDPGAFSIPVPSSLVDPDFSPEEPPVAGGTAAHAASPTAIDPTSFVRAPGASAPPSVPAPVRAAPAPAPVAASAPVVAPLAGAAAPAALPAHAEEPAGFPRRASTVVVPPAEAARPALPPPGRACSNVPGSPLPRCAG